MIELKNYQRTAVHELKERVVRLLNFGGRRNKMVFKAPTGSGKTVMVSAMMDELQRELKERWRMQIQPCGVGVDSA